MESKVKQFIESGILEAYVTGSASAQEHEQVQQMRQHHPAVAQELYMLEQDLEHLAQHISIPPPPYLWNRIESDINEITYRERLEQELKVKDYRKEKDPYKQHFLEVDAENTHMRVHKIWRWVFAAIFVLSKVFLIAAIYYYLENRQAQQNLQELRQQLKEVKKP